MQIENLVELAQKGDSSAFAGLYEAFFKSLYIFVRSKVDSKERAEDFCAETFITAFEKLDGFNGKSSFKTWLYSIANNKVNDWYRQKARHRKFSFDSLFSRIEFEFVMPDGRQGHSDISDKDQMLIEKKIDDNQQEVEVILQQIPPKYADVLRLRFLSKLTIKETAEVLNTTENNVKVMQNRAIKKAKELVIPKHKKIIR